MSHSTYMDTQGEGEGAVALQGARAAIESNAGERGKEPAILRWHRTHRGQPTADTTTHQVTLHRCATIRQRCVPVNGNGLAREDRESRGRGWIWHGVAILSSHTSPKGGAHGQECPCHAQAPTSPASGRIRSAKPRSFRRSCHKKCRLLKKPVLEPANTRKLIRK